MKRELNIPIARNLEWWWDHPWTMFLFLGGTMAHMERVIFSALVTLVVDVIDIIGMGPGSQRILCLRHNYLQPLVPVAVGHDMS